MTKTKLPKISTKTGDSGQTSLWSSERVEKNHPAIKCVGELDLFDSSLGLVYSKLNKDDLIHLEIWDSLSKIQSRLVYLKGEIATHPRKWNEFKKKFPSISDVDVDYLDKSSDKIKSVLEDQCYEIKGWIQYGDDGELSALIDYCRGLCRKSEIQIYDLEEVLTNATISDSIKKFINRLSDYLYWVARYLRSNL